MPSRHGALPSGPSPRRSHLGHELSGMVPAQHHRPLTAPRAGAYGARCDHFGVRPRASGLAEQPRPSRSPLRHPQVAPTRQLMCLGSATRRYHSPAAVSFLEGSARKKISRAIRPRWSLTRSARTGGAVNADNPPTPTQMRWLKRLKELAEPPLARWGRTRLSVNQRRSAVRIRDEWVDALECGHPGAVPEDLEPECHCV